MSQANQTLKEAMAVVENLSLKQRQKLTEHLIEQNKPDENAIVCYLRRLSPQKQERLTELMEKNNEGEISRSEKAELRKLNDEVGRLTLENSIELLRVLRPEAYKKQSRMIKATREKFLQKKITVKKELHKGTAQQ